MKLVKAFCLSFLLSVVFALQAFALKSDFQSVRDYHNQEIELLLKDYTLEDSLTIRVEIIRKGGALKDQEVVSLPGLYQKTGEASDQNIASILNLYDRRFVLIKKRQISDQELDLVKASLKERLFLPDDVVYTTLDNIPRLDQAVKNLKSDFFFGAYQTLIKNGQFLWILIFSIGFIIALYVLAKVWKGGKAEKGPAGEITISGSGMNSEAAPQSSKDKDDGGPQQTTISLSNSELETSSFESLCQNIHDAYKKAPGSTSYILWQYLRDLQTQIQFFEILRIQKLVPEATLNTCLEIINKIFAFEERASKQQSNEKGKGFNKEELAKISFELAKLRFIIPNQSYEDCLTAIYPEFESNLRVLFERGYDQHHLALYKIFKDNFMNYLSAKNDSTVLGKINDLLTFDPENDHASNDQYASLAQFIAQTDWTSKEQAAKKSVNSKVVQMIYGLPETELAQVEAMKNNEDLKAEIPNFSWIKMEELKLLKDFYANLSGPELKYLFEYDKKYSDALMTLDERIQFRVKERMSKEENMKVVWKDFRNKIKQYYKYTSAGTNETTSKAS